MTREEFLQIFEDIRHAIRDKIAANVPAGTRVFGREVFDDNESVWLGRLADDNGDTHCWSVSYAGCPALDDPEVAAATEVFRPTYRIIGYRGFDFGVDADNSSDKHEREVNTLRWEFMNDPRLGLDEYVNRHSGFIDQTVLARIDTRPVHITRVEIGVELLPIPYDFPA
ncbi:MAG: hypothetical protein ACK4S4_15820 [Pyrinomonadaceae bacterium]